MRTQRQRQWVVDRAVPFLVTPWVLLPTSPSLVLTHFCPHSLTKHQLPSLSLLDEGHLQGYFVTFVSPAPDSGFDTEEVPVHLSS